MSAPTTNPRLAALLEWRTAEHARQQQGLKEALEALSRETEHALVDCAAGRTYAGHGLVGRALHVEEARASLAEAAAALQGMQDAVRAVQPPADAGTDAADLQGQVEASLAAAALMRARQQHLMDEDA